MLISPSAEETFAHRSAMRASELLGGVLARVVRCPAAALGLVLPSILLLSGCGRVGYETIGHLTLAERGRNLDAGVPGSVADGALTDHCSDAPYSSGALVRRYSFEEPGEIVVDTAGTANGAVLEASLTGDGRFRAVDGSYVELPNDFLCGLTDASFESWFTSSSDAEDQRLFDFGSSDTMEGEQGRIVTSLYLSTTTVTATATAMTVGFITNDVEGTLLTSTEPLVADQITHVAIVFNDSGDTLTLYRDGELADQADLFGGFADLDLVNNWLGRSQSERDAHLNGTVDEFRVYAGALSAEEVQRSFVAGPEAELAR